MVTHSPRILYSCLMGSRLYGTSTPASDRDTLVVYDHLPNRKPYSPRHTVRGTDDVTEMSLSTFILYASRGSHQTLEAMFAPDECVDVDLIRDLRKNYYVDTGVTVRLYRRTIKAFILAEGPRRTRVEKSHRAALRMCYHLEELLAYGRFNPKLTGSQRASMLLPDEEIVELVKDFLYVSE